jgi:hypothetical protein
MGVEFVFEKSRVGNRLGLGLRGDLVDGILVLQTALLVQAGLDDVKGCLLGLGGACKFGFRYTQLSETELSDGAIPFCAKRPATSSGLEGTNETSERARKRGKWEFFVLLHDA